MLLQKVASTGADKYIDLTANALKETFRYLVSLEPNVLITILAGFALIVCGYRLVRSTFEVFIYGSMFAIAILILNYVMKYKK
jgi:TRAP-type C4-dicarboxylate transport system permease small subunit